MEMAKYPSFAVCPFRSTHLLRNRIIILSIPTSQKQSHINPTSILRTEEFLRVYRLYPFQTTQEHISSFRSSMMNKEIEAHYTQYLFLKRSVEWTKQKKKKYTDSQRLRATTSLEKYVNQQGYITTSDLDFFNVYLSNNVVSSFRNEGYENYPFKEHPDITKVFPNIKLTAKNCNE